MDNFKKYQPKNKKPASVDGFMPNTPKLQPGQAKQHSVGTQSDEEVQLIGASRPKHVDGFVTNTDRLEALPSLRTYTPIAIQPPEESKRRRWGRKRTAAKHKSRKRTFLVRGSVAAVSLLVIGGLLFGANLWWTSHKVLRGGSDGAVALNKEVAPELLKGEGDGRVNVLLLGRGGGDHPGADLTDSILIASLDPIGKEVALLSLPRDLWVRAPDLWSMKINAVFSSAKQKALTENEENFDDAEAAGIEAMSSLIEDNIGIPIHYYSIVNFQAFKQAVDAVGGVTINVQEPLYDYNVAWENGGSSLIADAGVQAFDGQRALLYARSRYTSSDFARGERQRQLVVGLKEKVLQLGTFSNPVAVTKLINAIGDNVRTNISLGEIMRMYEISKDIPTASIISLGLTDEPNVLVKTAMIGDQSVVVPRRGADDFSEIQSFVRNAMRDGFLKSEAAKVIVLNGTTTSGLATTRAEELKSYGYDVVLVDDAPTSDYDMTTLVDMTNGMKKYTKRYLEQRLKTQAVTSAPGITPELFPADFIVIVGNNETATL